MTKAAVVAKKAPAPPVAKAIEVAAAAPEPVVAEVSAQVESSPPTEAPEAVVATE